MHFQCKQDERSAGESAGKVYSHNLAVCGFAQANTWQQGTQPNTCSPIHAEELFPPQTQLHGGCEEDNPGPGSHGEE